MVAQYFLQNEKGSTINEKVAAAVDYLCNISNDSYESFKKQAKPISVVTFYSEI